MAGAGWSRSMSPRCPGLACALRSPPPSGPACPRGSLGGARRLVPRSPGALSSPCPFPWGFLVHPKSLELATKKLWPHRAKQPAHRHTHVYVCTSPAKAMGHLGEGCIQVQVVQDCQAGGGTPLHPNSAQLPCSSKAKARTQQRCPVSAGQGWKLVPSRDPREGRKGGRKKLL